MAAKNRFPAKDFLGLTSQESAIRALQVLVRLFDRNSGTVSISNNEFERLQSIVQAATIKADMEG